MPKYYVKSGQIQYIIYRENHYKAIVDGLKLYYGRGLMTSQKICVSESGWIENLFCYDTDTFLREIL